MMRPPKTHFVESKAQMAALESPARQEMLEALSRLGTASVGQIADALDRPPDALYYHLRSLTRVGLIVPAGHRNKGRRKEALFRTVAPRLETRLEPRTPEKAQAVAAIVGSIVRMANRDYRRSIKRADVALSGPHRELWAIRTTGWLTEAQVATVARLIDRLLKEVSRPKGPGRLYGATLVFTPLHHRQRERKKSA